MNREGNRDRVAHLGASGAVVEAAGALYDLLLRNSNDVGGDGVELYHVSDCPLVKSRGNVRPSS
jgi:hypothetical protein